MDRIKLEVYVNVDKKGTNGAFTSKTAAKNAISAALKANHPAANPVVRTTTEDYSG